MQKVTRQTIFSKATEQLRADFEELKASVPHAGTKGSEGEVLVREFLNSHLPQRFKAGAGFIIDHKDNVSKQTDVVIYDALNCPVYRSSEFGSIFPADNVAAIVEVKASLTKQTLEEAAENIAEAKSLHKTPVPDLPFLVQTQTMGCVVAFESPLTLLKLVDHLENSIRTRGGLGRHIDIIAVLDVGFLSVVAQPAGLPGWGPTYFEGSGGEAGEGAHLGIGAMPSGKGTIDAFLRFLLPHLTHFRPIVDHPGFKWPSSGDTIIRYLGSITSESDPQKRKEKLAAYRKQVEKQFEGKRLS